MGNPVINHKEYPDLKFAKKEVEEIGELFSKPMLLTGIDATETRLLEIVENYDILHLACHSQLDPANPLCSGLLLSQDEFNDGVLEACEVFSIDLNTGLVVLSGCETGLGKMTTGDEVVGLSRAFLTAGTPTLISSLWRVDDESTSFLMRRFYHHLLTDGESEALRIAQKETKEKYPDIFHWAPFVLFGNN